MLHFVPKLKIFCLPRQPIEKWVVFEKRKLNKMKSKFTFILLALLLTSSGIAQCLLDASFTFTTNAGQVSATNTSTNEPTIAFYDWWYGSQNSNAENPTFTQESTDQMLCLTVYDSTWSCWDSTCVMVAGSNCNLNISWTSTVVGGNISFTNTSTGEPSSASYAWLYNGMSSSNENPTFPYDPAVSQVCFAINDLTGNGCDDSICGPAYIDSTGGCNLDVDFSCTVAGSSVYFTDQSTGVPTGATYDWWYGSQNSGAQNPTFNLEPGQNWACLTVFDSAWTCYDSVCVVIDGDSSGGCFVDASFTYTIDSGYVYFQNTSTDMPSGAIFDWWYGSQSSTDENPVFALDSMSYACLTVYDSTWNCYDSTCWLVDPASASIETQDDFDFLVFPNPTVSEITIQLTGTNNLKILHLMDGSGRVVKTLYAEEQEIQMELNELQSGMYYLMISDPDGRQLGIEKIIKQ